MPLDKSIQKVLVIGSGPIVIGQAAEFDYVAEGCRHQRGPLQLQPRHHYDGSGHGG